MGGVENALFEFEFVLVLPGVAALGDGTLVGVFGCAFAAAVVAAAAAAAATFSFSFLDFLDSFLLGSFTSGVVGGGGSSSGISSSLALFLFLP